MSHTIVWFDLAVKNLDQATKFYSQVLDKKLEITKHEDFRMTVFSHEENDVAGCLYEKSDFVPNNSDLLIYFHAEARLDQAVAAAKANGGSVVTPIEAIGPYGFRAVISDCCGNKVALYSKTR